MMVVMDKNSNDNGQELKKKVYEYNKQTSIFMICFDQQKFFFMYSSGFLFFYFFKNKFLFSFFFVNICFLSFFIENRMLNIRIEMHCRQKRMVLLINNNNNNNNHQRHQKWKKNSFIMRIVFLIN